MCIFLLRYRTKQKSDTLQGSIISVCPSIKVSLHKCWLCKSRQIKPYLSLPDFGCIPFDQSKSGFCDPKLDISFHSGLNQSKIAIWTIHLYTWIVQIGISIWFQIFIPFRLLSFARWCSSIDKHGGSRLAQANVIYTPPLLYAAKGLYFTKTQVQKSDRINSDCQSGSDQLGSNKKIKIKYNWTRINSDHKKKNISLQKKKQQLGF